MTCLAEAPRRVSGGAMPAEAPGSLSSGAKASDTSWQSFARIAHQYAAVCGKCVSSRKPEPLLRLVLALLFRRAVPQEVHVMSSPHRLLRLAFAVVVVAGVAGEAAAANATCGIAQNDPSLMTHATRAREYLIAGEDADIVLAEWRRVFDAGASIAWPATIYNVDAQSVALVAFGPDALRIYRDGSCVGAGSLAEAVVPWHDVSEIRTGNWVLWIKFKTPVSITSNRGKRSSVRELKVNLHGAGGDLTFFYNFNHRTNEFENVRGIAIGPTNYQRRIQFVVSRMVDPAGRITLTRKGRGAGW